MNENYSPAPGTDGVELDFRRMLQVLRGGLPLIVGAILFTVSLAALYLWAKTPVYKATATLRMDKGTQGTDLMLEFLQQQRFISALATEVEIIQSRKVLEAAAIRVGSDIEWRPHQMPIFGDAIARKSWYAHKEPVDPETIQAVDDAGWVWGRVHLQIPRFVVPESQLGRHFSLILTGKDQFILFSPAGERLLVGQAGIEAQVELAAGPVGLFVAEARAAHYPARVSLRQLNPTSAAKRMKGSLDVEPLARGVEILELEYLHTDSRQAERHLSAIIDAYLQQNVEQRAEAAEKGVKFLDTQISEVRAELRTAESRMSEFRERHLAFDLDLESRGLLEQLTELETQIRALRSERTLLLEQVTELHPAVREIGEQISQLNGERKTLEDRVGVLPERQQELLNLQRDLEVLTNTYTELLTRAQELRLVKAGTVSSARMIDSPLGGGSAVNIKNGFTLVIALIVGAVIGISMVALRFILRSGVVDPQQLETQTGIPVYAVVPHSDAPGLNRQRKSRNGPVPLLADIAPQDPAMEGLRSLRTSLQFAPRLKAQRKVVAITGSAPGVGKTFSAVNFAQLLQQGNAAVLLIDADLRRGTLPQYFSQASGPGLSDYLAESADLDQILRKAESGLTYIVGGTAPPNPAELLLSPRFGKLIETAREQFDWIVIDTAPLLPVSDGETVATHSDAIFLVTRWAQTEVEEIRLSARRMDAAGRRIDGLILNDFKPDQARSYGYGYGRYGYGYGYAADKKA